ncbi:hypothetical protein [Microcystis aeruginosa]|uniref:Uncharacterized protein n=1 Tax=Microcystis aeruginosa NIES-2521 TaxID=2303983 RepID=A0A5A5S1S5_MICAE|nr:hypothetical protein [Microcystis aeruginosa]GCA78576.1 hypothetical protein MiTs_00558 [Microcystis aeruginosa NIES-2521]
MKLFQKLTPKALIFWTIGDQAGKVYLGILGNLILIFAIFEPAKINYARVLINS